MEARAEKVSVSMDGKQVTVLAFGGNRFEAYGGHDGRDPTMTSILVLKRRHIAAIEQVSGYRVTDSEYLNPFQVLQVDLDCKK